MTHSPRNVNVNEAMLNVRGRTPKEFQANFICNQIQNISTGYFRSSLLVQYSSNGRSIVYQTLGNIIFERIVVIYPKLSLSAD